MPSKLDQLTIAECREIAALFGKCQTAGIVSMSTGSPFEIGGNYFIRTVTHHFTGKLIEVHQTELVLTEACWIPSDGRFMQAVKTGVFEEVEPYPADARVIVGRGSILDAVLIPELPKSQK